MEMIDLIRISHMCDYHWYMDEMYICIYNNRYNEVMKLIPVDKFEDGIEALLRDGYVVIPAFNKVLEALGFSLLDIKAIFKEV